MAQAAATAAEARAATPASSRGSSATACSRVAPSANRSHGLCDVSPELPPPCARRSPRLPARSGARHCRPCAPAHPAHALGHALQGDGGTLDVVTWHPWSPRWRPSVPAARMSASYVQAAVRA